ncbi:MAG: hypothetical protein K2X48_07095 [Chitinophagaceae bacterium]|nr:hypothetical protein [Chitinophagaceae bacterium]
MQNKNEVIATIFFFVFIVSVIGTALLIIFTLYQRKFRFARQMETIEEENQKNLLLSQLEIQEQTFHYISQEIHDHIGQRLTLARLYLNSRKETDLVTEEELIEQSAELIGIAINDLKYLSRTLTADLIKDNGLIKAVELEAERLNKLSGLTIQIITTGNTVFMNAASELIIFRIVQEALQNIMKHAQATEASIHLDYKKDLLAVTITDNGKGMEINSLTNRNGQSGLKNMEQRALMLNGHFSMNSEPLKGTKILLETPIIQPGNTHTIGIR